MQSYENYQLIVINDGSTDNTEVVIKKYEEIFKNKGVEFFYKRQKNSGVAKACEVGLQFVKGDYLCWPDSDDYYKSDCIEKLLNFLETHPSYNLVRCNADVIYEGDYKKTIGTLAGNDNSRFREDNLIIDYIQEHNVYFAPICYMMRFNVFKEVNHGLIICDSKAGQNYQMLLPLLYKSKCGYIDECLCYYMVYKNSHSHSFSYQAGYNAIAEKIDNKYNCVYDTIQHMQINKEDADLYISMAFQKKQAEKCEAAFNFGNKQIYKQNRIDITEEYYLERLKWADTILPIPFSFKGHNFAFRVKQIIKNNNKLFFIIQMTKHQVKELKKNLFNMNKNTPPS